MVLTDYQLFINFFFQFYYDFFFFMPLNSIDIFYMSYRLLL